MAIDMKKLREIVIENLKLTTGDIIEDKTRVVGSKKEKGRMGVGGVERWKVNVLYTPTATDEETKVRFVIDAESGEVESFELGAHFSL